jgi:hypothetical protein
MGLFVYLSQQVELYRHLFFLRPELQAEFIFNTHICLKRPGFCFAGGDPKRKNASIMAVLQNVNYHQKKRSNTVAPYKLHLNQIHYHYDDSFYQVYQPDEASRSIDSHASYRIACAVCA